MSWSFLHSWQADYNLLPLQATWFVSDASTTYVQGQYLTTPWADPDDDFKLHRAYGRGYLGRIDRFQDSQGVKPTPSVWRLFKFAIQLFFASCFPRCHCRLLLVKLLTLPLASTKCFSIFLGSRITFTLVKGHRASFKVVFRRQRNLQGSCWKSPK